MKSYPLAFFYEGSIPPSKSLANRARIVQSYFPSLQIFGESKCEDFQYLDKALTQENQIVFDCGDGGTTFRFFSIRISRIPGQYRIKGSPRLLSRPQTEIVKILEQLGVKTQLSDTELKISSEGWKQKKSPIFVSQTESSQFLSALLVNSWKLDFPIKIQASNEKLSESYLEMTVNFLRELGMSIEKNGNVFEIPSNQNCTCKQFHLESDLSSIFSIASAAVLNGTVIIKKFPTKSVQPDFAFLEILKNLGSKIEIMDVSEINETATLKVTQSLNLKSIQVNLNSSPDLFPILSVLCAFADGDSMLYGAPQLRHKESNRIAKSAELLSKIGIVIEQKSDGMKIYGKSNLQPTSLFEFDPDHDHRMAMAAGLLMLKGFPIRLKNPEVVNKSFPEFWNILGVHP